MAKRKKDQSGLILVIGLVIVFLVVRSGSKLPSSKEAMGVLLYDIEGNSKGIPILSALDGVSNVGYVSTSILVINNGDVTLENVSVRSRTSGLVFQDERANLTGFGGQHTFYSDLYCVDETCGFYNFGDYVFRVNVTGFYEFPTGVINEIWKENSITLHIEQDQISYGGLTGGSTFGTNGTCLTGGTPCGLGQECCSGSCLNSTGVYECTDCGLILRTCSSDSDCCIGLTCEGGECHYDVGLPCFTDAECRSGAVCHDYICLLISGQECTYDSDCLSGNCSTEFLNATCGIDCGTIDVCGA